MSEAKERPILFSSPMVRAILDGSKTQTRRVVKPGHVAAYHDSVPALFNSFPYGKPGDRLWVRETWAARSSVQSSDRVFYRATEPETTSPESPRWGGKWRPSIFMPRWASRITLEVESVRVERLKSIGREDAAAEGVCIANESDRFRGYGTHRWPEENFQTLWESINGSGSWDANPWVWCISFRVVVGL